MILEVSNDLFNLVESMLILAGSLVPETQFTLDGATIPARPIVAMALVTMLVVVVAIIVVVVTPTVMIVVVVVVATMMMAHGSNL